MKKNNPVGVSRSNWLRLYKIMGGKKFTWETEQVMKFYPVNKYHNPGKTECDFLKHHFTVKIFKEVCHWHIISET